MPYYDVHLFLLVLSYSNLIFFQLFLLEFEVWPVKVRQTVIVDLADLLCTVFGD